MKLYYHETSGGAKYLFDTFIKCKNGHKEGCINDRTKYVIRIDGDITKDAELTIRETPKNKKPVKPTKKLFPYDAATGWQDLNIARMKYYQLTGKKC